MPTPEQQVPLEALGIKTETKTEQETAPDVVVSKEHLRGYKEWKQTIPADVRSLVEGHLLGRSVRVDRDALPSERDFFDGMRRLLHDPQADANEFGLDPIVQRHLAGLQKMKVGDGSVNLFAALADSDIGFDIKANYVQNKLLPRLEFLRSRDRRLVQKAVESTEKADGTDVTGENNEDEYSPHRGPQQEQGEGLSDEAVATIAPFQGGYVMDDVYDRYDPATLTWKKSPRQFQEVESQSLEVSRKRVYRSRVQNGHGKVKLPRRWGVDVASFQGFDNAVVESDQDGIVRVRVGDETSGTFSVVIAPSADAIDLAPPDETIEEVNDRFPPELLEAAQEVMSQNVSDGIKTRRIASIIHKHLEYDQDPQWEGVYKADSSAYFEKIWEHKKAKCDESNTLLVRLLTKLGLHARFAGGHSVRTKSKAGEALLLESNRHAWAFAWDTGSHEWVRLDATPAGDPNVDQEEQQEDLGEGDYGAQEAELMSQEALDKKLEELEQEELKQKEEEDPILRYAREAECTPEQAREVLEKIATLRKKYARVLLDADRQWQTLVRENVREAIVDRGPVQMSKMDEIDPDELVSGYIEILAGEKDPLIGKREETDRKKEKWFGGYEVYVSADMSGSMDETLGGVKKVDAQRDMVFLLVDSCMNASVTARKSQHKLKAPMPVKISVVVLGAETEIVLPLTENWGPKEQLILYRALDAGAGGSTPDHAALALIEKQIAVSLREQDEMRKQKPALQKHGWKTRRFVIATADGDSDNPRAVKQSTKRLQEMGIPIDLFLIGPEDDVNLQTVAQAAYPSVTPISNPGAFAEKGLKRLTERIKEAYAHPRH
ncbi:hypothetical protein HZA85_00045 [Candidatus Uhrbacteria bacterium]|nr:hypothetical protein [Candidatus Uhrbacteria bacterium]